MWSPWRESRVRLAALAAIAASVLMANEVRRAVADRVVAPARALATAAITTTTPAVNASAVALGPLFGVDGRADVSRTASATADIAPITLSGTIVGGERPAAVCERGGAPPVILHVGDTLSGWRLEQVRPAAAIFIDAAGKRHELRLPSPGN